MMIDFKMVFFIVLGLVIYNFAKWVFKGYLKTEIKNQVDSSKD